MLSDIFFVPGKLPLLKKIFWKNWYNVFAYYYGHINIVFMNYGYADLSEETQKLELNALDEKERYCLQLYYHVANSIELKGLDVLEVGCGRGGGSYFIKRHFQPKSMTGIDISEKNIALCRQNYSLEKLNFYQGDAESLQFDNCSFDAVLNIESSHCYPHVNHFFREVFRVLRPNGYFLFADFRHYKDITNVRKQLENTGFKLIKDEDITKNILMSMNLENERKNKIIQENIPKFLQGIAYYFAGLEGTHIYESFQNREYEYFYYVLQKKV